MNNDKNKLMALDPPFPSAAANILSQFPSQDGYLLKLFRMWAISPRHLQKFAASSLLDKASPITIKEREILILRTTFLNQCEYEWGVHVSVFAEKAGLSKDQIGNTIYLKVDPSLWSLRETLLLNIADNLKESGTLSKGLKDTLQELYTVEAQLEIFALCGFYTTVSFTANNSEIGLEPFAARFDQYG